MKIVGTLPIAMGLLALVLASPAWSSGYQVPHAIFVSRYRPDPPPDKFAAGRLGLIQPEWGTTYQYVAYRYLVGTGFDADEQKVLLTIWNPEGDVARDADAAVAEKPDAEADWLAARGKVPGTQILYQFGNYAPAGNFAYFINCHDDAFRTAIETLQSMSAKFGVASSQVKEWLDAQDLVFSNCPGPSSSPQIPAPLKGGTPFEQAQRTYQIAAATFYSQNFDAAHGMFIAIGADPASPWRTIAPYLAARATIRKGTLSGEKNDLVTLALAEKQLKAIAAGRYPDSLKASAQRLLGFVGCRLYPEQRHAQELRAILRRHSARTLAQDLKDFQECGTAPMKGDYYADDLDNWLSDIRAGVPSHLIDEWKRTRSPAWLVASIAQVQGTDPGAAELIKAAEHVEPSSPAYVTAEYHVDRILSEQGNADEARTRLDAMLARRGALPPSAVNQFSALRLKLAQNLNEYLRFAQRDTVAIGGGADEDAGMNMQQLLAGPLADLQKFVDEPLLDRDSVEVIDRWMPLSTLKQIARSTILPPRLRGRVALSVWVRAVLVNDLGTAREVAPIVSELNPDLKASLDAWLATKSGDQERFEVALTILRNPGMRPYVESGMGRLTALDHIDDFRDNWWGAIATATQPAQPTPAAPLVAQASEPKYPGFLSDAEKRSTDREWTALSAIDGPEYLCNETLKHAEASPNDERDAEALARCVTAVHLGPASEASNALAQSAFRRLHRRYASSAWAEKIKFWYRGGGSPWTGLRY